MTVISHARGRTAGNKSGTAEVLTRLCLLWGQGRVLLKVEKNQNMKNYTQVYVKNSIEAVRMYCEAFGAEATLEMKNTAGDEYEHCELSVNGEPFLAVSEAAEPCDIETVHRNRWQTMTFNVFEMGSEEVVRKAFRVLSEGGVVIAPIHALPWSSCCATVIDKYGVCWWISI